MNLCRVVGVIDADRFEIQVYQKLPQWSNTIGKPCVVALKSGRILAVSTEAKVYGITRKMKVNEAKKKCRKEELFIIIKKDRFTKPETKMLNQHSYGIRSAILNFLQDTMTQTGEDINVEKVGNDEYFLDLTLHVEALANTWTQVELDTTQRVFVEGDDKYYKGRQLAHRVRQFYSDTDNYEEEEVRLAFGLKIVQDLCNYIAQEVGIVCSGGVSSNKLLAKLACKLHKPNGFTSLTRGGFLRVSPTVSFQEITGFGGDLGDDIVSIFGEQSIQDLRQLLKNRANCNILTAQTDAERTAEARRLLNGICYEEVEHKLMFDGMNCRRNYLKIRSQSDFNEELNYLAQHFHERLQEEVEYNKRFATVVQVQYYRRLRSGCIVKEGFPMTFEPRTRVTSGGVGTLEVDEAQFFRDALDAITENPNFDTHLQYIVGICFRVTRFTKFGDVE